MEETRRGIPSCYDLCEFRVTSACDDTRASALMYPAAIDAYSPVKILMPLPVNMLRI